MKKEVLIFGSTGSIGRMALSILEKDKNFKIKGLCVFENIIMLKKQIEIFSPEYVCIVNEKKAKDLKSKNYKLFSGEKGLMDFSALNTDISIMAISGISCLKPLLENIKRAKRILLANKESIVLAGNFVFSFAKKYHCEVIPVDSEINALFQLFKYKEDFLNIYLTCSGGPLWNTKKNLEKITLKEVLRHPKWKMGKRITIDSATLVNKAFEVVEAANFFNLDYQQIKVVIHPEALIHAFIELKDGVVFNCMYQADMKIPLAYGLYYPERNFNESFLDFNKKINFNFYPLPKDKFLLFWLFKESALRKDNSLVILNAVDEICINFFLNKKIKFIDLFKIIEKVFLNYPSSFINSLDDIFYWDNWARIKAKELIFKL